LHALTSGIFRPASGQRGSSAPKLSKSNKNASTQSEDKLTLKINSIDGKKERKKA
jgi:hypothetical protein